MMVDKAPIHSTYRAATTEPARMRTAQNPPGRWRLPSLKKPNTSLLHQAFFLVVTQRARVVGKLRRVGRHAGGCERGLERATDRLHPRLVLGDRLHVLVDLSLIHISEPTRLLSISYAVFCLKKKKR